MGVRQVQHHNEVTNRKVRWIASKHCDSMLRTLTGIVAATAMSTCFTILATCAWGQTTQGEIMGTIRDEQGGVLISAKITVTNPATGLQRTTTTADNGTFQIGALPTGIYQVQAEQPGFAVTVTRNIDVGVDQTRIVDMAMRISAKAEIVDVEANAVLTQTESSKVGEIIDNRKVE